MIGFRALAGGLLLVSCSQHSVQPSNKNFTIPPPSDLIHISLDPALWRIGEDSTSELTQFGFVWHGVLLDDGVSVITDLNSKRAITVSSDGRQIALLGRTGEGPGEIREPSDVLSGDGHSLLLIDNALHRLTRYQMAGNIFQLVNSTEFTTQPHSLCMTGDQFLMLDVTRASDRILHHLDHHGRITSSFAPWLFPDSLELFNFVLTQGPILCAPEMATTIVALRTGDVIAYDPNGAVLWREVPEGYLPVGIEWFGGAMGLDVTPKPGFRSTPIRELHRLNDTLALLQMTIFAKPDPKGSRKTEGIDSRIYNIRTGAEVGRQRDLPEIFALRDGRVLTKGETDDVPWVEKRQYHLSPVDRK